MRDPRLDLFSDKDWYTSARLQIRIYLRHQFGDQVDVEEIADAAMERLLRNWKSVKDPLPWVLTVAKNLARDELKKAKKAKIEPLDEEAATSGRPPSSLDFAEQQLRTAAILAALRELPTHQQKVLVLGALGYTNREIAAITQLSLNSIAHYLYEGRKNLGKTLQYRRRRSKHPHQSVRPRGKG